MLSGLLAPPGATAATAPRSAGSAAVSGVSQPGAVPAAKRRPRASVVGAGETLASGKVRVAVTSTAKKVKLTYRTAKNKKRTATLTMRAGAGARTLAKGSKKIYAQGLKTTKLRASTKVRIAVTPKAAPPPNNPAPGTPAPFVGTPTITGWSTDPLSYGFGNYPSQMIQLLGNGVPIASFWPPLGVITEARAAQGDSWGAWETTDEATGGSYVHMRMVVPAPGTWQVRVRTLADSTHPSAQTEPRTVTMAAPTCERTSSLNVAGVTHTQCEILVRPQETWQRYVLQYTGDPSLAAQQPLEIGVYFHGDGADPRWPVDAQGQLTSTGGYASLSWALQRGALVVNPVTGAWGSVAGSTFAASGARDIARDIRALSRYLNTARHFYWGHSGGSWYLSTTYIPSGINLAPGPVALNCGAASGGAFDPLYTPLARGNYEWWWTWDHGQDTGMRAAIPIQFNYGDQDFLVDPIRYSIQGYKALGFLTEENMYPGVAHCGMSFSEDNITWFTAHLPAL